MRSRAQGITVGALLVSAFCVALLHIVRSDLPPVAHRLSEYANGPYGWMMTGAFVALGCGLVALGVVLPDAGVRRGMTWVMPAAAFLAGVGMMVSAAFRTGTSPVNEVIHSRASALATVAIVGLALAYSLPATWRGERTSLDPLGISLALTAAALAVMSPLLHDTRWTGLGQRLLWIALFAWLLRAARLPLAR